MMKFGRARMGCAPLVRSIFLALCLGLAGCGGGGGGGGGGSAAGSGDSASTGSGSGTGSAAPSPVANPVANPVASTGSAPAAANPVTSPAANPAASSPAATSPAASDTGTGTVPGALAQARYYASWTAPMSNSLAVSPGETAPPAQSFSNQTVRHVLRLAIGGDTLRLKLSNLFGTAPLTFSGVRLARSSGQSAIDSATDRVVNFNGRPSITLAPGAEAVSDPVALQVGPLANIAVSLYFAGQATLPTLHDYGNQTAYFADGDQTAASAFPSNAGTRQSYYSLTAVEAGSTETARVAVAFGDSITDGVNSTLDAARRYPDLLNNRLNAAGMVRTGVTNAGIAGNRWLAEGVGPSGNSRFERDVLNVAGASHVLILLGINDIARSGAAGSQDEVSAEQISSAIAAAAGKAKARGLKVLVGTLLPCKGAFFYSDAAEAKRQAVNAWIRSNGGFDGVIDFDAAVRNPSDPASLNPAYDSGDRLHPNDAGYGAMAAAVDLGKLQ